MKTALPERRRLHRLACPNTCPDLLPMHLFLLAYNNKPSKSHWNAALYALHYNHLTIDYGIIFTSSE